MNVEYRLFNPTGNITGLVLTEVSVKDQPMVAKYILSKEITCEQVGFISGGIEGSDITLRMAGGEFCGNATMSTAVLYCMQIGLEDYQEKTVLVKVIGTSGLIEVKVKREGSEYLGTVKMPKPIKISEELFSFEGHTYKYPVVSFVGISHVIVEDSMPIYMAENAIKLWADKLKVSGMGLMLVDSDRKNLRPLVYVNNPETLIWESSCASGTTATGAYFSKKDNAPVELSFREPGGILTIKVDENKDLFLSGKVTV